MQGIFVAAAMFGILGALAVFTGRKPSSESIAEMPRENKYPEDQRVVKSEEEWKAILPPEQFRVTRKAGTERAFTGEYWNNHEKGTYLCADCNLELFDSGTKYDSGTGWPSFYAPIKLENLAGEEDTSLYDVRDEVLCARCGAHLGHVFGDGPAPTGLRYCMNSISLKFEPEK